MLTTQVDGKGCFSHHLVFEAPRIKIRQINSFEIEFGKVDYDSEAVGILAHVAAMESYAL